MYVIGGVGGATSAKLHQLGFLYRSVQNSAQI